MSIRRMPSEVALRPLVTPGGARAEDILLSRSRVRNGGSDSSLAGVSMMELWTVPGVLWWCEARCLWIPLVFIALYGSVLPLSNLLIWSNILVNMFCTAHIKGKHVFHINMVITAHFNNMFSFSFTTCFSQQSLNNKYIFMFLTFLSRRSHGPG